MSLFDEFKNQKKNEGDSAMANAPASRFQTDLDQEQPENIPTESIFYEESGGVTREQAIQLLQGAAFPPEQPMGVSSGEYNYGVISYPGFVVIFFGQDKDHPMRIAKRVFMTCEDILNDVFTYVSKRDFAAAADCVWEALEQNQGGDEHWEIYCTAGEVLWKLRDIQSAHNLFLKAYQCRDCKQKAHVLCQAAATSCILRDPNKGYALYRKALDEEPESLEVLHDLGGFHWDMGELGRAAEYYFSVLKKNPCYYASYEELANLFGQFGELNWSESFMDFFTKRSPLSQEQLKAAEVDMMVLLEKQGNQSKEQK